MVIIDKREYNHKTYVRVKLPLNSHRLETYLSIKKPEKEGDCLYFEYEEEKLFSLIQFFESVFKQFGITFSFSESINIEIDDLKEEQKSFSAYSNNANIIKNNKFSNVAELQSKFIDYTNTVKPILVRKLYPKQFLCSFHMAFSVNSMNFSVPGAGKTSIVYAAYSYLKHKGLVERLLIVGPLSSFQAWEDEYKECFGQPTTSFRYSGVEMNKEEKKHHLYSDCPSELNLIFYQGLEGLSKDLVAFMKKFKVMLIVDEAHRIKNVDGKWGKNITKIAQAAKSRVALTGTPIPNGYEDIYNIVKFIYPNKVKAIIKYHISQLKELSENPFNKEEIENLKSNISPFFMRIRKEDLPGLPSISESTKTVEMGKFQDEIYSYIVNLCSNLQMSSTSNYETEFLVRAMYIRLRQAATNPYLLSMSLEKSIDIDFFEADFKVNPKLNEIDDELFDFGFREKVKSYYRNETPTKINYCFNRTLEILSRNNNQKVLIWTIFTENAKFLKRKFDECGVSVELLIGEVETTQREHTVRKFNDLNSNLKVVIANPFTVGESVSLHHGCNHAIYLERDYNCSNFIQSKDRIHRVGSKFPTVFYDYLESDKTIDTEISKSLRRKVERMTSLIDDEIPFFKLLESDNEEANLVRKALELYRS